MECPVCHAPEPDCAYRITANDGGSTVCDKCGVRYHKCKDGVCRFGHSPLTCPHCGYKQEDHYEFLGSYRVNKEEFVRSSRGNAPLPGPRWAFQDESEYRRGPQVNHREAAVY